MDVWNSRTRSIVVPTRGNSNLYATDEEDSENVEEANDNKEHLRARCLLEECETEQWHEVVSKREQQKVKKANAASLLIVESSHNSKTKEIIELKDRRVKVRVTMESGAAGHVIPETMFPRVKLERKISPKKLAAANGEQIRDLGERKNQDR